MSAEDTLPYAQNISQRLADKRNSRENVKDVDVVMKNARKSCLPSTKPKQYSSDVEQIPTSYSGTWSNNVVGPRATIIKVLKKKYLNFVYYNTHASGWSLWSPSVIKSILWATVSLNRLLIFCYYPFILTPIIEIKIFEKKSMPWKNFISNFDPSHASPLEGKFPILHTSLKIH